MASPKILINVGCGTSGSERLPACFADWQHVRVDIDADVQPDIVADILDLSVINEGVADAVWTSHCIEHLYQHEVTVAFQQLARVLKPDGCAVMVVPDLQTVARYIAEDRLTDVLYQSPAGPITPRDVVFGHGASVASGKHYMAHKTGFTPSSLIQSLEGAGFAEIVVRRRPDHLELVVIANRSPWTNEAARNAMIDALGL
jgi:SAM-dependent methyltransferase